jgi:hypothetical protein
MVDKLALCTKPHPQPYYIQWLNNSGKMKVIRMIRVNFSIGSYHDSIDCDVVPMQACSMLLDRPWQYDIDSLHHSRTNQYSFVHIGKKLVLHPMSPEAILKDELARASKLRVKIRLWLMTLESIKRKTPNLFMIIKMRLS